MSIFRTKTIEDSIAETGEAEYQLKKRLSAVDLTVFGIGVIIGAGIFTLTGRAAKEYAGPSILKSRYRIGQDMLCQLLATGRVRAIKTVTGKHLFALRDVLREATLRRKARAARRRSSRRRWRRTSR